MNEIIVKMNEIIVKMNEIIVKMNKIIVKTFHLVHGQFLSLTRSRSSSTKKKSMINNELDSSKE